MHALLTMVGCSCVVLVSFRPPARRDHPSACCGRNAPSGPGLMPVNRENALVGSARGGNCRSLRGWETAQADAPRFVSNLGGCRFPTDVQDVGSGSAMGVPRAITFQTARCDDDTRPADPVPLRVARSVNVPRGARAGSKLPAQSHKRLLPMRRRKRGMGRI